MSMLNETTQSARLIENYISILEKTNQQLGVWSNPYGIAIGILSILIAIIAIGVAYAFWLNGREQRERQEKFFADQDRIIQLKNKSIGEYESKLDTLIKEYQKQLKSTEKRNREQIQKTIDELKREKASIGAYIGPSAAVGTISGPSIASSWPSNSITLGPNTNSMICAKCGKRFSYIVNSSPLSNLLSIGNQTVHCTYCGSLNLI